VLHGSTLTKRGGPSRPFFSAHYDRAPSSGPSESRVSTHEDACARGHLYRYMRRPIPTYLGQPRSRHTFLGAMAFADGAIPSPSERTQPPGTPKPPFDRCYARQHHQVVALKTGTKRRWRAKKDRSQIITVADDRTRDLTGPSPFRIFYFWFGAQYKKRPPGTFFRDSH